MNSNNLFTSSSSVQSSRILYIPSPFVRSSLLHLQEVGSLTAIKPHTSKREKLQSYLCFMVEDGERELVYEGKRYDLKVGDVVFIDCRKTYSRSTGNIRSTSNMYEICDIRSMDNAHSATDQNGGELWSLRWYHFYGPSMPRPKGSKNKSSKKITVANNDFDALIAEKSSAKENLTVEIASLEESLTALKADLKAKKAELKTVEKELGKLEEMIQKLMTYGVSAAEILEKLK